MVQQKQIPLGTMRLWVQYLASVSGLRIQRCLHCCGCGVGRRRSLDPALLWLWRRPAATVPIRPLVWEPPYAADAAPKRQNNNNKIKY